MGRSHSTETGGLGTTRLEALVDGVFAVVMTLLILDIKVPPESGLRGAALARHLVDDLYKLRFTVLTYAISFVIAGIYWVGHHNQFAAIRRADRMLLWINILFLLCVAFIPFSTSLLGKYPDQQVAVALYGSNLIVIGLALSLHWWYATHDHRLTDGDLDPLLIRRAARRILAGPVAYLLAIGLSFANPALSIAIYVLVPVLYILPGRLDRQLGVRGPRRHATAAATGQHSAATTAPEEDEPDIVGSSRDMCDPAAHG